MIFIVNHEVFDLKIGSKSKKVLFMVNLRVEVYRQLIFPILWRERNYSYWSLYINKGSVASASIK